MVSGSSLYDNDVHVVTGVIKGYLRDGLPPDKEPICTYNLYDAFIEAAQMDDWRAKMITIQDLVHSLPARHFACLKYVCEHLRRVSLQSPINKMSIRNLSIIFGPNLLK
ncbi:Rho GTPase activation protein, partial [Cladochytrium replicatum]